MWLNQLHQCMWSSLTLLILSNQMHVEEYLIVFSNCIFLSKCEVQHLLVCLLAVWFPCGKLSTLVGLYYINSAGLDLFPRMPFPVPFQLGLTKENFVWDLEGRSEAAAILLWKLSLLDTVEIDRELSVVHLALFSLLHLASLHGGHPDDLLWS